MGATMKQLSHLHELSAVYCHRCHSSFPFVHFLCSCFSCDTPCVERIIILGWVLRVRSKRRTAYHISYLFIPCYGRGRPSEARAAFIGTQRTFKKRMGVWHLGISGEKSISRRAGYRHISTLHILKEGRFRLHFRGGRMRRIRQMARKIGVGNQRNRSAEWTGLPTSSAKSKAFALHRNDGRSGYLVD